MPSDNFDIKLTVSGQYSGNALPLRLMSQDGRKMWVVNEYPTQANNPSVPVFSQTDWSGGMGQGNFKDPSRYSHGENIDTSEVGRLFLGPLQNATYCKNLLDGAVAYEDDGVTYTDETSASQQTTANDMTLLQSVPGSDDAYYFGSDVTFTQIDLNIGTQGVGTWTITWEYYDTDTTWTALANVTDNTTGFTATTGVKTVTFNLPATWATTTVGGIASKYWVRARVSAYTSVTTQPKGTQAWVYSSTMNADGPLLDFEIFSSKLYATTAKKIFEWDNTNGYWWNRYITTGNITDIHAFGSNMFVALGNATAYLYTSNGTSYTTSTTLEYDGATTAYANYFLTAPSADSTNYILWKAKRTNEIASNSSGINGGGNWTSPIYVGDTSNNIRGLMLLEGGLLVGRDDGLYLVENTGMARLLLPTLKGAGWLGSSIGNFTYSTEFQNGVYFNLGSKLGEISPYTGIYDNVGPFDNVEEMELVMPRSCGPMAGDESCLYVNGYQGASGLSHIYKGRPTRAGWQWCPWVLIGAVLPSAYFVDDTALNNKRLWYNNANTLYYVILSEDYTNDTAARFTPVGTTGYLVTGWYDAGNRDWAKMFHSVLAEIEMTSNRKVTIYYEIDTSGTWVQIDTAFTALNPTGGVFTKKYADLNSVQFKKIRFKIELNNLTLNTVTPIVRFFGAYGEVRPTKIQVFDFWIDIEPTNTKSKTIKDFLDAGRDSTVLVTLNDIFNANHNCVFEPGYPKHEYVTVEPGRQPRLGAHCVLRKVDWS